MKKLLLLYIAFMLIANPFLSNGFAQDYTQWQLPEGAKMRLGKGKINDITFSSDGTRFAVAATIGIWIYDAETGEEFALLTGHQREVKAVEFSLDGRTFTSVDAGGETRLWDATTRKLRAILTESTDLIEEVALSSNGTKLVTANVDDKFRLWHLGETDQEPIIIDDTRQRVSALALSPDGSILASSKTPHHNSISQTPVENFRLQVWDTTTQKMLFNLPGDTEQIHTLVFSPDGRTLAGLDVDGKAQLWDADTGTSQLTLKGNERWARMSEFSSDGRYLAIADSDGNVRVWDITIKPPHQSASLQVFKENSEDVSTLELSPDGKTLLVASESGTIRAWNIATGNQHFTITGHIGSMLHLTFSETDKVLTSINSPNFVWLESVFQHRQWDVRTGNLLFTHFFESDGAEKISPDGGTVLVDHRDGTLDLWDIHAKRSRSTLKGNMKDELNVQFALSLDGKVLAGVGKDRIIRVWKSKQSAWRQFFSRLPWGRSFFGANPQFTFKVHRKDGFGALALSPDGKILAHARTLPMTVNTTVYLYSTETGENLRTLKAFTDRITDLVFSPDGKTIAGGNREAIHLWDTLTGTQLRVCTLERLAVSVTLVFSPDSSILISAARGTVVEFPDGAVRLAGGGWLSEATSVHGGGSIQLWEAHTGDLLATYTGHTDRVQTLAFSKDEKTLASGSADGTILLWDWETLKKANNR
ncbi:hypothetical protein C6503_13795 [Candidatus Poribacteria bacterium]|nr:MAG: hypothetical protein C6503_13795 [Candidatus Poribacteria bacterium]